MLPLFLLLPLCFVERLERIPWIAPECVDSPAPIGNAADQWSFGVTLLEICNNGDLPMSSSTLAYVNPYCSFKGPVCRNQWDTSAEILYNCAIISK